MIDEFENMEGYHVEELTWDYHGSFENSCLGRRQGSQELQNEPMMLRTD
jgi:hypothetical protein